jgi:hypothetical protein
MFTCPVRKLPQAKNNRDLHAVDDDAFVVVVVVVFFQDTHQSGELLRTFIRPVRKQLESREKKKRNCETSELHTA